jgi:hypothetical protein
MAVTGYKAPAGRVSGGCGSTTGDGDPAADYAVTTGPFRKGVWTITIFDYSDQQRVPFIVRQLGAGHPAPDLPTVDQLEAALSIVDTGLRCGALEHDADAWQ